MAKARSRKVKIGGRWYVRWRQAKSAVDGGWVSAAYAKRHPHLTMWITVKRKTKAPK